MSIITSMDALELLSFPFAQRALIAGAVLGVLMAVMSVFVTLRRMSFFGEGVAHASLAGIAIAILAGVAPLPLALGWAVLVALGIYLLEKKTQLSSDALIGILFTASMALGVILMGLAPGYQPELVSFLFGSILSVSWGDVALIMALGTVISVWIIANRRSLAYLSLSEDSARVSGIAVDRKLLAFYVALAIATVLGVKILGIILVSALLVLPAATSRLLAGSFSRFFWLSLLVSEAMMMFGILLSFQFDLPSGATVVLVGTATFLLAALFGRKER